MKTSTCRDGNPQKPIKLDGNDTTTISHHPYILYHFANNLPILMTCQSGTSAMLFSEVNDPVAHESMIWLVEAFE